MPFRSDTFRRSICRRNTSFCLTSYFIFQNQVSRRYKFNYVICVERKKNKEEGKRRKIHYCSPNRYCQKKSLDPSRYTGRLKFQRSGMFARLIMEFKNSELRSPYVFTRRRVSLGGEGEGGGLYSPQFLSRCSQSFNDDGGREGRKKAAKSPFVCGLRNRKKRQFTLLSARTRSPCARTRARSLDFLVKPATRVSLDQWR